MRALYRWAARHNRKVVAAGGVVGATAANAALDPAISTGLTTLTTDATDLGGLVMAAAVTIGLIPLGIRLFKKLVPKAV